MHALATGHVRARTRIAHRSKRGKPRGGAEGQNRKPYDCGSQDVFQLHARASALLGSSPSLRPGTR